MMYAPEEPGIASRPGVNSTDCPTLYLCVGMRRRPQLGAQDLLNGSRQRILGAVVEFADLPRVEPVLADLHDRAAQQLGGQLFDGIPYRLGPSGKAAVLHGCAPRASGRARKELGRRVEVERDHLHKYGVERSVAPVPESTVRRSRPFLRPGSTGPEKRDSVTEARRSRR